MATTNRIASKVSNQLVAAAMAAAAKVCTEASCRDDLPGGAHHQVKLSIAAEVDGTPYCHEWAGTLDVGHDSVRASSNPIKAGTLLAYLLSRQNEVTREATLRTLADVFESHGCLPVDEEQVKAADECLQRLRQKVDQSVRGTVRISKAAAAPVATPETAETVETVEAKPLAAAARKTTAKKTKKG